MPYNYKTELAKYRKYYQSLEPLIAKTSSKAYTTVVFSFLAVSLFGWYAIRPTLQTILYLQREIADKTVLNKQMEDKISALIEAQAYYQEIEPLLPAVDQALPIRPDGVPIAIQLRNLASYSGVLITTLQIPTIPLLGADPQENKAPNGTVPPIKESPFTVSISVQGGYAQIRSFLDGIINMRRIMSIYGITLSPSTLEGEESGSQSAVLRSRLLQLTIRMKTFYIGK